MIFNVEKENWRKIGVYCITNSVNGKIYIGSTTTNFRHRFLQYKSGFLRELDNQPLLYRAFRKYGFDNFLFEILCVTSKEDSLIMEQFYIDKGTDYNMCMIAGSLSGLLHSSNSKTRTIIRGNHHCAIKVDMYSLKGEFIKSFDCLSDAQVEIGIKSKSNISQCCKGKVFSAGGYRWSHKGIDLPKRLKREAGTCKIVLKKDSFYKEFHSQKDASEFLKSIGFKSVNQGRINRSISKTKEKVYGYTVIKL